MNPYVLLALVALGPSPQPPQTTRDAALQSPRSPAAVSPFDGTWTVVYAESNGRRMDNAANSSVTIRGGVLGFNEGGRPTSMRLDFGPQHLVWAYDIGVSAPAATGTGTSGTERSRTGAGTTNPGAPATTGSRSGTGTAGQGTTGTGAPESGTTGRPATPTTGQPPAAPGAPAPAGSRPGVGTGTTGQGAPATTGQGTSGTAGSRTGTIGTTAPAPGTTGTPTRPGHQGVFIASQEYLCIALNMSDLGTPALPPGGAGVDRGRPGAGPAPAQTNPGGTGVGNDRNRVGTGNTSKSTTGVDRGEPGATSPGFGSSLPGPGGSGTAGTAGANVALANPANQFVLILRKQGGTGRQGRETGR